MDKKEQLEKDIEEKLLSLLQKYHHYKFMTNHSAFTNWYKGMSLGEFMEWLKSRER